MGYALVFLSDIHAGSTVGMLHPDGVQTDEQVWIKPSKLQLWLWQQYQQCVKDVEDFTHGYERHLFLVGDMTEGVHHKTVQVISGDKGVHIQAAADVLHHGILQIPFETVHMVRGTPAHVDANSGLEKSVASHLVRKGHNLERHKRGDSNSYVAPYIYAEYDDVLFDIRHHGRSGKREHTRGPYLKWYAQDIYFSHLSDGRRPPDIAVRAHLHKFMDSGPDHRGWTRALQTPCFQLRTAYIHRRSIETLPDIGCCVVLIDEGRVHVKPFLYQPEPDPQPIWRPAA